MSLGPDPEAAVPCWQRCEDEEGEYEIREGEDDENVGGRQGLGVMEEEGEGEGEGDHHEGYQIRR